MANRIIGRINGVKVNKLASVILGMAIGLSGCGGSGTNNDQGTSFLATGFGGVSPTTGAATGSPISGATVSILDTSSSAGVLAAMNFQNRLSAQFLRVDQISCAYEVPGSNVSLYQDSTNTSVVIPPGAVSSAGVVTPSVGSTVFQLISRDVISYFANRLNDLPQLPTRMNVTCSATAISQAGDVFQSNPLGIQIVLSDDEVSVDDDLTTLDEGAVIEESELIEGDDTTLTDDGDTGTTGDESDGTSSL